MHDLTEGSIPKHILQLAWPMALGMIFQTLYLLVDLYFVALLGDAAIAGVSAASTLQFIVMALTQVLGVGTMVLIAHAAGRKDQADANLVFNQSLLLSALAGGGVLVGGWLFGGSYLGTLAADAETVANGMSYLAWFLPALALQFALISMGSALRGTGIAKPTMIVQMLSVVLNAVLAPILIAGWGTGRPMGVAGAALASTIAVSVAVIALLLYFVKLEHYVRFDSAQWRPHRETWMRLLRIGVPAGGEFGLMFVSMAVIYWIIRDFGAAAQAGFGVGGRVMQSMFLPVMAIAFAAAPVAAQNVAAGKPARAREAFWAAVRIGSALMAVMTLFVQWRPALLIRIFTDEPEVIEVAAQFLSTISWNFIASGIVFTCSGMFQAMGNTIPSVISSAVRLIVFVVPAVWISRLPGFQLHWTWRISVAATTVHALFALWLVRREAAARLGILIALLIASPALARSPLHAQPASVLERALLTETNLARANPAAYAAHLEGMLPHFDGEVLRRPGAVALRTSEGPSAVREAIAFLRQQAPRPPLEWSDGLAQAARDHVRDQGRTGETGHEGSDGSSLDDRTRRYGSWLETVAENIEYGANDARDVLLGLIVDDGVPNRGHRANVFAAGFRVMGAACGPHPRYRQLCVIDYAGGFTPAPR